MDYKCEGCNAKLTPDELRGRRCRIAIATTTKAHLRPYRTGKCRHAPKCRTSARR